METAILKSRVRPLGIAARIEEIAILQNAIYKNALIEYESFVVVGLALIYANAFFAHVTPTNSLGSQQTHRAVG